MKEFFKYFRNSRSKSEDTQEIIERMDSERAQNCAVGRSHVGLARINNEDFYIINDEKKYYIVADGMGGHNAGEVASQLAVKVISDFILENLSLRSNDSTIDLLEQAIKTANSAIVEKAERNPELQGMGTTVVIAIIDGDNLYLANVGDSRAYLFRDGILNLISLDHSVGAEEIRRGESDVDIRRHPMRNRLTSWLGVDENFSIFFNRQKLVNGDLILLCTDGLWDMVEDDDIARILSDSVGCQAAAQDLLAAALNSGGHDNATFVLIPVV